MRAMAYDAYGSDDVLTLCELPDPKVGPGEVRIRVRRAGVNPVDWKVMSGGLDGLMDVVFPVVPGWDVAGTVETVGIDTPEFEVGDEVVAYARKDVVHGGTFAELVTMSVRGVARKSSALSWDEAGGLPLTGLTGLQTLDRLLVTASDTVLVHGGAGGVGALAVQIARARGARVIATASPTSNSGVSMPTASTVPATSQPGTTGNTTSIKPSRPPDITFQSTGFTPARLTRIRTSPGPTFGSGSSHRVRTSSDPYASYAMALMAERYCRHGTPQSAEACPGPDRRAGA